MMANNKERIAKGIGLGLLRGLGRLGLHCPPPARPRPARPRTARGWHRVASRSHLRPTGSALTLQAAGRKAQHPQQYLPPAEELHGARQGAAATATAVDDNRRSATGVAPPAPD